MRVSKESDSERHRRKKGRNAEKARRKWIVFITIAAFLLSVFMSTFSDMLLRKSTIPAAFLILIGIIFTGILFDIIGVAVTVADEKPFHSMAASKVRGAKDSLMLIRNASRVSNVCSDVAGDICGIISGTSAAFIIAQADFPPGGFMNAALFSVTLSGAVAALTIGGKAFGKEVAMNNSKEIITLLGRILSVFRKRR